MTEPLKENQKNITTFAPVAWHSNPEKCAMVARGYRVMRVDPRDVPRNPFLFDVGEVRGVFVYGNPDYFHVGAMIPHVSPDGAITLVVNELGKRVLPPGWYLILMAAFRPGDDRAADEAWRRTEDAAAVLAAIHGRNILYEVVFDTRVRLDQEQQTAASAAFRNPHTYPSLCCNPANFALADRLAKAVPTMGAEVAERTFLSLRWFRESLETDGVDSMIKLWIALEMLAMPDTTNIRPLSALLRQVYATVPDGVPADFAIGRIYGLRCRIVHAGSREAVDHRIIEYLQGVYVDCLLAVLNLPPLHRVRTTLTVHKSFLTTALHEL